MDESEPCGLVRECLDLGYSGDNPTAMYPDSCCASGSRRACATVAVTNALNAADVVAVLAAPDYQARLAEAVRRDLEKGRGHQVLPVEAASAVWLEQLCRSREYLGHLLPPRRRNPILEDLIQGAGKKEAAGGRSILEWSDVDAFIGENDGRFDRVMEALYGALCRRAPEVSLPFTVHKAVLIGGERLMGRIERLAERADRLGLGFRYILVH